MDCSFKQTKKFWINNNKGKRIVYEFEERDENLPQNKSIYVFGKYDGGMADKLYRKYPKVKYIGFLTGYTLREDFI